MKKVLVLLCMLAMLIVGSDVFAGSIDYLSNQSARYLMTFSRVGATDAADIVAYNPAGTAFLAPGLYLDFSSQTLFKPYSQESTVDFLNPAPDLDQAATYEQDEPTPVLPNFYAVYNFGQMGGGNLAAFFSAGIVAGGGTLKWDKGTPGTGIALQAMGVARTDPLNPATTILLNNGGVLKSQSLEVSSVYYGLQLGAAYSFLDNMVSVSFGGRVVMPKRSIKIDGQFTSTANNNNTISGEYEYDAVGYTPIIGVDIKPMNGLTIGIRYEHETDLEFEYSEASFSTTKDGGANPVLATIAKATLGNVGIADGNKFNNNLPSILSIGAEYVVMPGLNVMTTGTMYFLSNADLGKTYDPSTGAVVCDTNEFFDNGWEISVGATYKVMPELTVGAGFIYTVSGAKTEYFNNGYTLLTASGNPPLDSWAVGLGGTYTIPNMNLDITLAGSWTHYLPETYSFTHENAAIATVAGKYEKDVYNIAFGVGYRM